MDPIYKKHFKELEKKHPWYKEWSELVYVWNDKVKEMKAKGEDPKTLFDDPLALPVDEVIGFAKAVYEHPDVWYYFADYVEREKSDPNVEFDPEWLSIVGPFSSWYFLHRGKPIQRDCLSAGRGIILKFLRGELPSLDGKEAREYALSMPGTKE